MKNLSKEYINSFLHKCLTGEYEMEGWQHPLGFGHIKIHTGNKDKIRLHFWKEKTNEFMLGEPDRVHNHAFDFISYVLKGGLMEKFYEITVNSFGTDAIWEIENKGDHSVLRKTSIRCNKKPGQNIYHKAGENYEMSSGDFHDTISTEDNTITLVFENSRPEVSSLMICSNLMEEIVREKWPILEKKEIFRIINLVFNKSSLI